MNLKTLYVRGLVNQGAHDERIDFVEAKREDVLPHVEAMTSPTSPIPMRLPCERCGALHIDVGEFATKPHHTHTCQHCGLTWRPAKEHTVGVQWIPGWKNAEPPEALPAWPSAEKLRAAGWGRDKASEGLRSQANETKAMVRGIHIGSKWRHIHDGLEYTVTHVDNDNQFHCMSGVTEWIGTETEFRKQFIWVRNP